jgi:hypothetical protein
MNEQNPKIYEDLVRLRDELVKDAFHFNSVKDQKMAEVVFKINSCLYKGYPRINDED